jgi:GMP synthase-like glutamine amidotransferase
MRIHYLIHFHDEQPGFIADWATSMHLPQAYSMLYCGEHLPTIDSFDMLVIMGGPMGVYEDDKYQWLQQEKKIILSAITNNKIVLGICLGSQLIAAALGKHVFPNKEKEIGFWPVHKTTMANNLSLFREFPDVLYPMSWHGDTFDLPDGAIHLFYSEACTNQAFIIGNRVIGLQFHFETTLEIANNMLDDFSNELTEGNYIQSRQSIQDGTKYIQECNRWMKKILNYLTTNIP